MGAIWMLVLNILSAIAGPTLVGFITTYLLRDDIAVGSSVALANCLSIVIAGLLLWAAIRPFRDALERQEPS
jgi:UPF0716 family protein affecting phage T7 exclusion